MRRFDPQKVPLPGDFRILALDPALPLDIEIGCGVGFHPLRYAQAYPERQLLAFERTSDKFAKFSGRIAHHKPLKNLFPVHGDAIPWITHGIAPKSVDRYFILYPNPYPKKNQRNLRFPCMPFFSRIVETMKAGATLTMATNADFYYHEAKHEILDFWGLRLMEDRLLSAFDIPRSHFEKKYLTRGDTCWNLIFRKE